ncbi:hypothetical protein DACRYDRAFT_99571 [Dacryopinax primogenitus]|uniref:Uncharacterized protein n=1 Tax=Dacryopinax primogenitus (strain DJM 731) TaxID=1858805 RepID=M5G4W4_DACPD|nr:uncharacterized protein DACRYDRAFT_99571 [Dacryopinax primogenitus]EJU03265.1 hypothetical protein DACRYDRAFT_99571 [Dacryopinax primogenitus]
MLPTTSLSRSTSRSSPPLSPTPSQTAARQMSPSSHQPGTSQALPPLSISLPVTPPPVAAGPSSAPPLFEAPALPRKIGELNYTPPPPGTPLPATPSHTQPSPTTTPRSAPARILNALIPRSRRLSDASSTASRKKKVYTVFGLHVKTLAFFFIVLLAFPGTIAAWALASIHFGGSSPTASSLNSAGNGNAGLAEAGSTWNKTQPVTAQIDQQMPSNMTLPFGANGTSFNTTNPGLDGGAGVTPLTGNSNTTVGFDNSTLPIAGSNTDGSNTDGTAMGSEQAMMLSGIVFLHVAFTIGSILELLMLDRLLFQLIQQRRQYRLPGFAPATAGSALGAMFHHARWGSRDSEEGTEPGMGEGEDASPQSFLMRYAAPWNRPQLPSYRTAIGVREQGTGDVEDEVIVGPAPPEYGNTRGSVLLLQAALARGASTSSRRSVRSTRSSRSTRTTRSTRSTRSPAQMEAGQGDTTVLGEEGILDAEFARRLEEALSGLDMPAAPLRAARD